MCCLFTSKRIFIHADLKFFPKCIKQHYFNRVCLCAGFIRIYCNNRDQGTAEAEQKQTQNFFSVANWSFICMARKTITNLVEGKKDKYLIFAFPHIFRYIENRNTGTNKSEQLTNRLSAVAYIKRSRRFTSTIHTHAHIHRQTHTYILLGFNPIFIYFNAFTKKKKKIWHMFQPTRRVPAIFKRIYIADTVKMANYICREEDLLAIKVLKFQ